MTGELIRNLGLGQVFGEQESFEVNAPNSVFLNLSLSGVYKMFFEGSPPTGAVLFWDLFIELGRGNPPDFGFAPIRPFGRLTWDDAGNPGPPIQRTLSRSFDAIRIRVALGGEVNGLPFDVRHLIQTSSGQIELEWGTEDDVGPIGISTGTF